MMSLEGKGGPFVNTCFAYYVGKFCFGQKTAVQIYTLLDYIVLYFS